MEKINLDEKYNKWRDDNIQNICDRFQESDKFEEFVEECWNEYQDEKGLIDESNEEDSDSKDEESEGIHLDNL